MTQSSKLLITDSDNMASSLYHAIRVRAISNALRCIATRSSNENRVGDSIVRQYRVPFRYIYSGKGRLLLLTGNVFSSFCGHITPPQLWNPSILSLKSILYLLDMSDIIFAPIHLPPLCKTS